jgi:hypothetical protein
LFTDRSPRQAMMDPRRSRHPSSRGAAVTPLGCERTCATSKNQFAPGRDVRVSNALSLDGTIGFVRSSAVVSVVATAFAVAGCGSHQATKYTPASDRLEVARGETRTIPARELTSGEIIRCIDQDLVASLEVPSPGVAVGRDRFSKTAQVSLRVSRSHDGVVTIRCE